MKSGASKVLVGKDFQSRCLEIISEITGLTKRRLLKILNESKGLLEGLRLLNQVNGKWRIEVSAKQIIELFADSKIPVAEQTKRMMTVCLSLIEGLKEENFETVRHFDDLKRLKTQFGDSLAESQDEVRALRDEVDDLIDIADGHELIIQATRRLWQRDKLMVDRHR